MNSSTYTGQSVPRREDSALLTGQARFMNDLHPFPRMKHAAILRSPHAHATIVSIDLSAARALRGVVEILTGKDVAELSKPFGTVVRGAPRGYCCAVDKVRYVGEPVAVIVADSRYVAEDALDLIKVRYEPLAPAPSIEAALAPDAPLLHESHGSNVVHRKSFVYGAPEEALAAAEHRVSVRTDHPRINSTPLETYGIIANFERLPDRYTVWSNFQGPFILQPVMSAALNIAPGDLRLLSPPASGGSFGIKQGVFSYIVLIALASRKAGVPVKWIEDHLEHLAGSLASTGRITDLDGGFSGDGRLLALRWRQVENVGAYMRPPEPSTLYRMHGGLSGPYRVRDMAVENTVVVTNQLPAGLNRGYGGPQYVLPLERLMDKAARALDLDPAEIRRRNLLAADDLPYVGAAGQVLDGGDYHASLDHALELAHYPALRERCEAARREGRLFGIGLATSLETSVSGMAYVNLALTREEQATASRKSGAGATATVAVDASGGISVWVGTTPNGQGHQTVIAQVVADELGVAPDSIRVLTDLDTARDPWSITSGNYSNRFAGIVVSAAATAAGRLAVKLKKLAAQEFEVDEATIELADGVAVARGGANRAIPITRLGARSHWDSSRLPDTVESGMVESATVMPTDLLGPGQDDRVSTALTTGLMCDVAAVEIDPATGRVRVDTYVAVHDLGRILHPKIVEGQAQGGFAHGIGAALYERLAYDSSGAFLSGTFADYLCPTAPEMPDFTLGHVNTRTDRSRVGAKGIGDGASTNMPAAIANAVTDALGGEEVSLPLTPPRVWSVREGLRPDPSLEAGSAAPAGQPGDEAGPLRGRGEIIMAVPRRQVWEAVNDIIGLREVIPGCQAIEEIAPDRYHATIRVSIAGIGGIYDAEFAVSDRQEPSSLVLEGRGDGALGFGSGRARLTLSEEGPATRLTYTYGATVGGRVAAVGHRMLNGAVQILLDQFFDLLEERLTGQKKRSRLAQLWRMGRAYWAALRGGGR